MRLVIVPPDHHAPAVQAVDIVLQDSASSLIIDLNISLPIALARRCSEDQFGVYSENGDDVTISCQKWKTVIPDVTLSELREYDDAGERPYGTEFPIHYVGAEFDDLVALTSYGEDVLVCEVEGVARVSEQDALIVADDGHLRIGQSEVGWWRVDTAVFDRVWRQLMGIES